MYSARSRLPLLIALSIASGTAVAQNHDNKLHALAHNDDVAELSIEQLFDIEVFTSSRFPQKSSEAPSTVTVIDADNIRTFGYRTLSDILASIPGLYTSYDRNYSYLGSRGYSTPGDYNTRFLVLLDGKRVNDNIYDSFGIDYDGIVNVDLIDRVEYSSGPGSAVYGANAVFGVINIITRNGEDIGGVQASAEYGSENSRRGRVSAGNTFENGLDAMISASAYQSDGDDRYYAEFDDPATNNGVANDLDYHEARNLFLKLQYNDWGFSTSYSERTKGIPTASYGQVFNTPPSETTDTITIATVSYEPVLNKHSQVFSSLSLGRVEYSGDYSYDYPPITVNRDEARGDWLNAEARYQTTLFSRQKIVTGIEYQKNIEQYQNNFDVDPFFSYLDDSRKGNTVGIYIQDEIRLTDKLILNAGLRYDKNSFDSDGDNRQKSVTSPRLAIIYALRNETTLKAIYGSAYRNPNAYELYYGDGGDYIANTNLEPEEIETYEIILENYFSNQFRLTGSVYTNETTNLISFSSDPDTGTFFFDNIDKARAVGTDITAEYMSDHGARMRASYSYVDTEKNDMRKQLINSPMNLVKFNLSLPMFNRKADAGIEYLYKSDRSTPAGGIAGSYSITNLTLSSREILDRLELSASIYNLFDEEYADPASEDHEQNSIAQDGRHFRVKLTYTF